MRNGFTLVELVVVVLILAILAAIASPRFFSYSEDANVTSLMSSMQAIVDAAEYHYAETGEWPTTTGPWNAPGEFEGYINQSAMTNSHPLGVSEFAQYAVVRWESVPGRRRVYYPYLSPEVCEQCDEVFDDGQPGTGSIRLQNGTAPSGVKYVLISYYQHQD